ncbi:hypothetical protein ADZ36_28570 [Streptomyces fradiae]|uniref:Uncharacterized protein n=1 Tax=Streptomyces fradiae TaxID=1906 RepID=A0ACC4W402_STRFR|nr:hypothetical protein ADZ36_28570 [Streptomyces fradiae]OFA34064.1 hypothetical protein BEN35_31340 [Streptomyces fradiae]
MPALLRLLMLGLLLVRRLLVRGALRRRLLVVTGSGGVVVPLAGLALWLGLISAIGVPARGRCHVFLLQLPLFCRSPLL